MFTDKTLTRIIGALFIIATASAIAGGSLLLILDEPTYLADVTAGESQIVTGVVLELILVVSVVGIAVFFHPVLRRYNEGLSLAYVGARTMEAVLLLAAAMSALPLLALAGDPGANAVEIGDVLLASRDWTYLIGSMVFLGVGGLILYPMLYRARLIPSWLSVWGLVAAGLILIRGLFEMYGVEFSNAMQAILAAPIAIQEMVMAVWLLARGFNKTEVAMPPRREPTVLGA